MDLETINKVIQGIQNKKTYQRRGLYLGLVLVIFMGISGASMLAMGRDNFADAIGPYGSLSILLVTLGLIVSIIIMFAKAEGDVVSGELAKDTIIKMLHNNGSTSEQILQSFKDFEERERKANEWFENLPEEEKQYATMLANKASYDTVRQIKNIQ